MGLGIVATAGATMGFDGIGIAAAKHDASHVLTEKAYEAPEVGKEGYKPYWHCAECCTVDANSARYDFADKDTQVGLEKIVMAPLTGATEADIAEGDEIGTINKKKFKYVDQGVNGVDGTEGDSTPLYIKDSGKTALFFSRSGKTGEAYNATDNTNCSEFRFSPVGKTVISSVTFSYRYLDYGKGVWNGGSGPAEPAGWHSMIQFKDTNYYGKAIEFQNDDTWHEMTLTYKDWESAGSKDATTNFTDLIIKFVDLRGHFMISGLKFNVATTLTLKNTTADGTDVTKAVTDGTLPEAPTMEGKKFLGWYDEAGNKVTSTAEATTLVAKWAVTHYNGNNEKTTWSNDGAKYTKPEGCDVMWYPRSTSDRESDIKNGWYPAEYTALVYGDQTDYGKNPDAPILTTGVGLMPFDFSKVSGAQFTFGFMTGIWQQIYVNGVACGQDGADQPNGTKYENFTVTVIGKKMTVHTNWENKDIEMDLSDDVYTGKKGIEIKVAKASYAWLLLSDIVSLDCDYVDATKKIEAALPDTPTESEKAAIEEYQTLRSNFTTYEAAAYPVSSKMQTWIDAMPRVVYSFDDHGVNTVEKVGGSGLIINDGVVTEAYTANSLGNNLPFSLGDGFFLAKAYGMDTRYCSIKLPAFNFSQYKTVRFAFGFGGNSGGITPKYAFGLVTEEGITDLANASNYIGAAPVTSNITWDTAQDTVAIISNGKITFNGSNTIKNKVFDLSEDVNNGTNGLVLTVGNASYEFFALSPFTGLNL